jgi:hypothetical protein
LVFAKASAHMPLGTTSGDPSRACAGVFVSFSSSLRGGDVSDGGACHQVWHLEMRR